MGGRRTTTEALKKQVQAKLVRKLTANACTLLGQDSVNDIYDLEILLKKIAMNRFREVHRYNYDDEPTNVQPPAVFSDTMPFAKLCSITPANVSSQANDYLKAAIFSKLNLPRWMERTAVDDFSAIANTITSCDTEGKWKYIDYNRTYDARMEDQDTLMCNAVLVYAHTSLVEDAIQAELAVIFYCGVFYKTVSETKVIRDKIQESAYRDAARLEEDNSVPRTDELLEASLENYAKNRFRSEFGYNYEDVPPNLGHTRDPSCAFRAQNSQLYYVPDANDKDLEAFVKNQIYSGIAIPLKSVQDLATADTCAQYRSILRNGSTGSWNLTRIDKTYTSADPTNNPIRQNGIIMSWNNHKTTDNTQKTVSVTYIYIMTVFYECQNPEQELSRALFTTLCNNLRRHVKVDDGYGDIVDPVRLKEFMFNFAKQEFEKAFDFEYSKNSVPPRTKPGGRIETHATLLQLKSYPATESEVEALMNLEGFRRDPAINKKFPSFAVGPICDDLREHMLYYGGTETPKDNNWWYTSQFSQEYCDPSPLTRDIQQFAIYVYALGDMTLARQVGDREGVHMKRLFVYYLALFCTYDRESDTWS